jgi:hypothetical protein
VDQASGAGGWVHRFVAVHDIGPLVRRRVAGASGEDHYIIIRKIIGEVTPGY